MRQCCSQSLHWLAEHLPVSEIYKVCSSSSVLFGWAKITLVSGDSCIVWIEGGLWSIPWLTQWTEYCRDNRTLSSKVQTSREGTLYYHPDNASNMCKAFLVLEELATDVNMDSVVLDADDLWDDLEATHLDDVSLTFQCTVSLHWKFENLKKGSAHWMYRVLV